MKPTPSPRNPRLLAATTAVLLLWLCTTSPTLLYLWEALTDTTATWADTPGDVQDALLGAVVGTAQALRGVPLGLNSVAQVQRARATFNAVLRIAGKWVLPADGRACALGTSCDIERIPAKGNVPPLLVVKPKTKTACNVLFLNIHGGGWVFGEADDPFIYIFAGHFGCPVVSVEYGLAPEVKFPVPVHESAAALEWVCRAPEMPNRDRVVVTGASAGGNLVAAVAHKVRSSSCAKMFVPIVPVLSAVRSMGDAKFHSNAHLPTSFMAWFLAQYAPGGDAEACARDPLCSPLAETNWASLPPMTIVYGTRDVLAAEAVSYVKKLRDAGYDVPAFPLRGSHYAPGVRPEQMLAALRAAVARVPGARVA